jgi:hypothetical protein
VQPRFLLLNKPKMIKKIQKRYKRIKKKIMKMKFGKPSIEDIFFAFLIIFSLAFSAFLFNVGEQIKEERNWQTDSATQSRFETKTRIMTAGHPIKNMLPFIAKQDKDVAAYLIAIAKKESNWGKYAPQKNGKECFNYWGYRGNLNQTDSGYSCFRNPQQAVNIVGARIQDLIAQNINTPREMVIWKCGQDCSGQNAEAVDKWINDVAYYRDKVKRVL